MSKRDRAADSPERDKAPTKRRRGYCTRLRGPHAFALHQTHTYAWWSGAFEEWRCTACGKKKLVEVKKDG